MANNPLSANPIPEAVRPFLVALEPLDAAVAEAMQVRAAYMLAAREVRRLRDESRSVAMADQATFAAALRKDPNLARTAVKQGAEDHQKSVDEAAKRVDALSRALGDANRDVNRLLRDHRPALLADIAAAEGVAQAAVVEALDDALGILAQLAELRTAHNWANGSSSKATAGQLYLDARRAGAGPQPVGVVLAEVRQLLAAPAAATEAAELDAEDG